LIKCRDVTGSGHISIAFFQAQGRSYRLEVGAYNRLRKCQRTKIAREHKLKRSHLARGSGSNQLKNLVAISRYERRALSRRKLAIRELHAMQRQKMP
jgi:hypothetical protein